VAGFQCGHGNTTCFNNSVLLLCVYIVIAQCSAGISTNFSGMLLKVFYITASEKTIPPFFLDK